MTKHPKEIAALVTLLLVVLFSLILTVTYVSWNPDKPWPPEPDPFIELALDEFVEPEVIPLPSNAPDDLAAAALAEEYVDEPSQAAPESGTAPVETPAQGTPAREVTTAKTSTVKEKPTPKPKTPGTENNTDKEKDAVSKRTRNDVANAFARPNASGNANNGTTDEGKATSPNGRADAAGPANSTSKSAGVAYGNIGGGWQWPRYNVGIKTGLTGTVVVTIAIDAEGNVTAKATGGKAPAASNKSLQKQCEAIAASKRFVRSETAGPAPARSTAILTFIFE